MQHDHSNPARRSFLRNTLIAGAAALPLSQIASAQTAADSDNALPESMRALKSVAAQVVPIGNDERIARVAKAQRLMAEHGIDAVFIGAGSSLTYFTGMRWWDSERLTGVIIPRRGEPVYVTPEFERVRTLEQIKLGNDVRGWQEDEDPYALIAKVLRDMGHATGTLGMEEAVPYFRAKGIADALPQAKVVPAWPVVSAAAGSRALPSWH